jgi:colanic acid/amylovoran biosynthesis glycosyltransferase
MRLAIFSPNPLKKTETFIRSQIEGLEAESTLVCDGYLPTKVEGIGSIGGSNLLLKLVNRVIFDYFPKKMTFAERALLKFLKKEKFDGAVVHYGPTAARSLRVLQAAKLPFVVHFHGMDAFHVETIAKYGHYRAVFAEAKAVIAVSQPMLEQLKTLNCPPEKLFWNPCAPSDAFFSVNCCFCSPTFLFVGRFVPKKAPDLLLEAFKIVQKSAPETRLIMAGDGPLREKSIQKAAELGISNAVSFPGNADRTQIMRWMSDATAYVQHSIHAPGGDSEGTPVVILEAAAAGLPVVSTLHAGIPATVLDGETGFLVAEKDVEKMAEKMLFLAKNPEIAEKMGKKGRIHVQNGFSMQLHLARLTAIIESGFQKNKKKPT